MRIGIDVGGTHTDAVLLDGSNVLATHKALTSADVSSGILDALHHLLGAGIEIASLQAVMIGTTQFTNAVIERRELSQAAAIRLGLPSGAGLPPMIGWPVDIAAAIGDHAYMLHGGYLYDGQLLASIDDAEIDHVIAELKRKGLKAAAITSAFSPMNAEPELYVAKRLLDAIPDLRITLSHRIGRVGLLERENAAILNAALLDFADRVVSAFRDALDSFGITCPIFISQNDGTLMDLPYVREFPALTFASGPTNSLRGAAWLTGLEDAIVIDIGGTTSDVGILRGGFPRESNMVVEVGGVRTNFRMPDLLAIGLGGGSLVSVDGTLVGPRSVGHRLVQEGMVFGGTTLTTTDIAVAAGMADVGSADAVAQLDRSVVQTGCRTIATMLHNAVRKMKPSSEPLPIILVGGGTIIVPDSFGEEGGVYRPKHAGVANAIGAAIAQVGGEAERFVNYREITREAAMAIVTDAARTAAIAAGANPGAIRTTEIDETPIPYMEDGATRLRVKVVGEIAGLTVSDQESLPTCC